MKLIGLTGGIASGKSTVGAMLTERGYPVVCADVIAREVVAPGSAGLEAIVEAFGEGVLLEDGSLNRPALGAIIFKDASARERLNAIVHPLVQGGMAMRLMALGQEGHDLIFADIPLLYEARNPKDFDAVVVVWVDGETQLKRLMARDGSDEDAASARIKSQMSLDEKRGRGDHIIDNRGAISDTKAQVDALITALLS